ncbi:dTDP-4-dehydrorhamnose reductase [bacterium]|nr:dTDP-4-dehydrorhamnose reductase [bacterium]
MKNVCILGAGGQLGQEFVARCSQKAIQHTAFTRQELDICDEERVRQVIGEGGFDTVVNAAAYTAVDRAQDERELAFAVNRDGARNVARAAQAVGAFHLYFSTDYVFGGKGQEGTRTPFREDETCLPCNVYGESKRAGEEAVLEYYAERSVVLRTSSVHGSFGANFVHTMLRLIEERSEISVVHDQIMAPTWTGWLAAVIEVVRERELSGVLHVTGRGALSWYEFAVAIRELARFPEGVVPAEIHAIPSSEYPTPAPRPRYSVLDLTRFEKCSGVKVPSWKDGLSNHLSALHRLDMVGSEQTTGSVYE